nr:putative copia-like polyprotein [Tanacetum cinerariifolium]
MVVRTLDVKDLFRTRDVDEEILGPKVSYLSAIGALMFFAGHTRPDLKLGMYSQVDELQFHGVRSCGISSENDASTVLYEDNAACIAQLKECYIKGDMTKHILPKFFFTHDLQKNGDIIVQQVHSSDNLADLFTNALLISNFRKLSHNIGMRQLKDLNHDFIPLGFPDKVFNEAAFLKRINGHRRGSVMDKYEIDVHIY